MKEEIVSITNKSSDRFTFCSKLIDEYKSKNIAELGVFRGNFAKYLLDNNSGIETYTMIDPWRNLSDWNKPANKDNETFEELYQETLNKTDFAKEKREILRGKTTEIVDQIENDGFDFLYIDGDHTLKGISIDLISLWPKVKKNGVIVGDDFSPSIWQHSTDYEPTMVFPFAVYFAEAVNRKIYGLPYDQFLIPKEQTGFEFIDLTAGNYSNLELKSQLLESGRSILGRSVKKKVPFIDKITNALRT